MIRHPVIGRQRLRNLLHSLAQLGAMGALLGAVGWAVAGGAGVGWALLLAALLALATPELPPALVMGLQGGRALAYGDAPQLYEVARLVAARAGLGVTPTLYLIPSPLPNAVTSGGEGGYAIGFTDALLRRLDLRQLAGVIAHETAHVVNGDLRTMAVAALLGQLTASIAFIGLLLLFLYLPAMLLGAQLVVWWLPWLLLFAPRLSGLLQLALSRTREFDADLEAVTYTGDPQGLAAALMRLEAPSVWWPWSWRRGDEVSPWLRTHPATEERVARLLALQPRRPVSPFAEVHTWRRPPPVPSRWRRFRF